MANQELSAYPLFIRCKSSSIKSIGQPRFTFYVARSPFCFFMPTFPQQFLQNHLACPQCRVIVKKFEQGYQCPRCGTRFEAVEGVPVMLLPGRQEELVGLPQKKTPRNLAGWRRLKTPPSPCLNVAPGALSVMERLSETAVMLEIGSGTRRLHPHIINLDIDRFPQVDVVAAGDQLPFADELFDLVVCEAVLEHVRQPNAVVAEMVRVLKPGGQLYVETPFLEGFHADPHDYQRYTLAGLEYLLREVEKLESGIAVGPASALGWLLREYLPLFAPVFLRKEVALAVAWMTTPFKYLDWWLVRRPEAHRIAAGFYFWGQKRGFSE